MGAFFRVVKPSIVQKPKRLSYSALREIESCAAKWTLAHGTYEGIGAGYPSFVTPASMRGAIVHFALERFAAALEVVGMPARGTEDFARARMSFPIRQIVNQKRDALLKEAATNPRANLRYLEKELVVDVCINAFKRLVSLDNSLPKSLGPTGQSIKSKGENCSQYKVPVPAVLPERFVELEDPPLCGRIDLVETDHDGDRILEFKTGVEQPSHSDQIDYYAFLWATANCRPVKQRTLAYLNGHQTDRGGLSAQELKTVGEHYKARFTSAMKAISADLKPSPSIASCEYCDVRQLCDSYWQASETSSLRWNADNSNEVQIGVWKDYEIILSNCTITNNVIYSRLNDKDGQPRTLICIVPHRYMEARKGTDTVLRVLNVLLKPEGDHVNVTWGPLSEAYWK